ncbi:MAG: hypothetical protein R3D05_05040 [Dongiaceae bacterium]
MIKVVSLAALLVGLAAFMPIQRTMAITTETAADSGDKAQIVDSDGQSDGYLNPNPDTDGSATIDVPPIDIPGDSDEYDPPSDSDDDPAADDPAPSTDPGSGSGD